MRYRMKRNRQGYTAEYFIRPGLPWQHIYHATCHALCVTQLHQVRIRVMILEDGYNDL